MAATTIDIPTTLTRTSHKLDLLVVGTKLAISSEKRITLVKELNLRVNTFRLHLVCDKDGPSGASSIAKEVWVNNMGKGVLHMTQRCHQDIPNFYKALLATSDPKELPSILIPGMNLVIVVDGDREDKTLRCYVDFCENSDVDWILI